MTSNYLRIVESLDILDNVLAPFIVRELRKRFGNDWWSHGVLDALHPDQRRHLPHGGGTDELIRWLDAAVCLSVIERRWHEIFESQMDAGARSWVRELHAIRNQMFHKGPEDVPTVYARHAIDLVRKVVGPIDARATERLLTLSAQVGTAETPL